MVLDVIVLPISVEYLYSSILNTPKTLMKPLQCVKTPSFWPWKYLIPGHSLAADMGVSQGVDFDLDV